LLLLRPQFVWIPHQIHLLHLLDLHWLVLLLYWLIVEELVEFVYSTDDVFL